MQPEHAETGGGAAAEPGAAAGKNDALATDDGLDQAIQRAIAQHDLEQQQLQQQQQQLQQQLQHTAAARAAAPGPAAAERLSPRPQGPRAGGYMGGPDQRHAPAPALPLLDAAQEKQHLQMIAAELKRAASDASVEPRVKAEQAERGGSAPVLPPGFLGLEGLPRPAAQGAAGDRLHEIVEGRGDLAAARGARGDLRDMDSTGGEFRDMGSTGGEFRDMDDTRGEFRDMDSTGGDLRDMDGTQGDFRDMDSTGGEIRDMDDTRGDLRHMDDTRGDLRDMDGTQGDLRDMDSTRADLRDIHNSHGDPHAADGTPRNLQDIPPERSPHIGSPHNGSPRASPPAAPPGHIPAHSELLATNSAVAAYKSLSSLGLATALLASAHLAALPLPIVPTNYMPARIQLLVSTLAVLDNLATQLLRVFAAGPYQKIIDLASSPDTAPGAAFRDLTSLFEFSKRLYSEEDPFLSVEHIAPGIWKDGEKTPSMFRSREQTIELTLRKVNLATFLAATLGTIEVGFFHLNESFLHVFCPANDLDPANSMSNMSASNTNLQSGAGCHIGEKCGKLLKPQASLYLDLKTQAYISAVEAGERSREEILEDILPANLEHVLQERRATKVLSPTEMDFVHRCHSRKEMLLNYPPDQNLNEEYEWFEFLKELFEFVLKNMGFLLWGKKGKPPSNRAPRGAVASAAANPSPPAASSTPHSDEVLREMPPYVRPDPELPGRAEGKGLDEITAALLPSEIQEQQIHLRINPGINSKGPNRRPWTRQEEKALRHAMELKGTQWSVILELFGQGGRINESLKNRTQVQLKDKARNWKMFFLKSGLAVPNYLQKVTGDLDRDDKLRAKLARNKKTAAAPVPTVSKRDDGPADTSSDNIDDELRKKRRVE